MRASGRILELDGVRGIAILLILMVHFGDYALADSAGMLERTAHAVLELGWTGVDLFFVLSGLLITGILLDARGSPNYFRAFYFRRALRILPLYYGSVAVFFWLVLPIAHAYGRGRGIHSGEQIWYWLYLANWRIAFNEYAVEPLSHFWSLAIEEQFYLVWPWVVWYLRPRRLRWVCGGAIMGALALRCLPAMQGIHAEYSGFLYNLTPFRVDSLAWGAVLATAIRDEIWSRRLRRVIVPALVVGLVGFIAAVAAAHSVRPFSAAMGAWGYSAIGVIFAATIWYGLIHRDSPLPSARMLRHPLLRSFGKYSYAMYVIHWPISLYLTELFQRRIASGLLGAAMCIACGTALTYLLGMMSWNWWEKHFLRFRHSFPYLAGNG